MDAIAEIIRIEGKAETDGEARSNERWKAARLIWEQLQTMTYQALSDEIKARGGKGSLAHLTWMKRSWELIGQHYPSGKGMPPFGQVYRSPEVRAPADRKRRNTPDSGVKRRERGEKQDASDDDKPGSLASQWVAKLDDTVTSMGMMPAAWQFITDKDLATLAGLPDRLRDIHRAITEYQAQRAA